MLTLQHTHALLRVHQLGVHRVAFLDERVAFLHGDAEFAIQELVLFGHVGQVVAERAEFVVLEAQPRLQRLQSCLRLLRVLFVRLESAVGVSSRPLQRLHLRLKLPERLQRFGAVAVALFTAAQSRLQRLALVIE